jgi:hypothetical protein
MRNTHRYNYLAFGAEGDLRLQELAAGTEQANFSCQKPISY